MKNKTALLIFLIFNTNTSIAATQTDLTKDTELAINLNLQPYATLQTLAFGDLRSDAAYTSIFKSGSTVADALYYVSINARADGPILFFSANESCLKNSVNEKDLLNINGTNVLFTSVCIPKKDGDPDTIGYTINTDSGRSYVIDQFTNSKFVFVEFRGKKIPFETGSFIEAWEAANSPAL